MALDYWLAIRSVHVAAMAIMVGGAVYLCLLPRAFPGAAGAERCDLRAG